MSPAKPNRVLYVACVLVVLLTGAGVLVVNARRSYATRNEESRRTTLQKAGPRTAVTPARRGPAERRLELQGEARPFAQVTLYAKVSGYLRTLRVERGDRVKAGQVLAVIQSPELDRQYEAAQADAEQKRANAKRVAALAGPGAVSVREAELEKSRAHVADATLAGIASQRSFAVLRAPFDGTITARHADLGALVQNAANGQSGALPVVTVSQVDRLRVFVYVDQRDAVLVHVGDSAQVSLPDSLVKTEARVARTSGELDPRTRTLLVELEVDNKEGQIIAGSFVTVRLALKSAPVVEVPVEALVMRAQKPFVPVVAQGRISLRGVEVASHDGERVGVRGNVHDGDLVALNLGHGVNDGDVVQPVPLVSPPAPGAASNAAKK